MSTQRNGKLGDLWFSRERRKAKDMKKGRAAACSGNRVSREPSNLRDGPGWWVYSYSQLSLAHHLARAGRGSLWLVKEGRVGRDRKGLDEAQTATQGWMRVKSCERNWRWGDKAMLDDVEQPSLFVGRGPATPQMPGQLPPTCEWNTSWYSARLCTPTVKSVSFLRVSQHTLVNHEQC